MQEAYLFYMHADPPAHLWSGVGDLDVPGDALAGQGVTRYKGIGTLQGLPALENLINGTASDPSFSLSGVDPIALGYAHEDRRKIPGSTILIGSIAIGDDGATIGNVDWEWRGVAVAISISSEGTPDGGRTRTITLDARTATAARSTSNLTTFTDADQRKRSADDAYFTYVAGLSSGTVRTFGPR